VYAHHEQVQLPISAPALTVLDDLWILAFRIRAACWALAVSLPYAGSDIFSIAASDEGSPRRGDSPGARRSDRPPNRRRFICEEQQLDGANILWLGAGRRLGGCTFAAEQLSTCLPSRLCNHTPPKSHFLKSLRSLTRCGRGSPSVTSPRGLRSDLIHGERPGRAEMVASQLRMTRRQFAMFIIRGFLIRHGWEVRFNPILTPF